jgi:pilus assembly protein CpaC
MLRAHKSVVCLLALFISGAFSLCAPVLAQVPPSSAQQQSLPEENGGNQVVHILVGHSVVVHTDPRLTRVLVGNAAVVSTETTAPNEVVVTAIAPGSSSVVLWQENNQSRIIEVFADVDVSLLRDAITRGFPGEAIEAEAEEGRVVLSGKSSSAAVADQIGKMAVPFSKDVVNSIRIAAPGRQKQVMLKVRFAEVDRSVVTSFGVNLLSVPGAKNVGSTSTGQFSPPNLATSTTTTAAATTTTSSTLSNGFTLNSLLNIFLYRPDIDVAATINDLQQRNVLQILAEPNLLAANGEAASFLAGGELPYPVVTGAAGQTTVSVQFKPFGVRLEFTGTIEADNTIRLKILPEVSSLDYTNAVTISGFTLPAISTRHAETVVELRDGQSFGIAGLLDRRTTDIFSKMPGIGDLPIIGLLFRSKSVNKTNTELLVIVTPTIVDPAAAMTPPPELPKMPTTPLDPKQFDTTIPGEGTK